MRPVKFAIAVALAALVSLGGGAQVAQAAPAPMNGTVKITVYEVDHGTWVRTRYRAVTTGYPEGTTFTYKWTINDQAVKNGTKSSLAYLANKLGVHDKLRVRVVAKNSGFQTNVTTSKAMTQLTALMRYGEAEVARIQGVDPSEVHCSLRHGSTICKYPSGTTTFGASSGH